MSWRLIHYLCCLALWLPLGLKAEQPNLSAQQALAFDYEQTDDSITLNWQVAPGYYLIDSALKFKGVDVSLGEVQIPAGDQFKDPIHGERLIHRGQVSIEIPLAELRTTSLIEVSYQGCHDSGHCFEALSETTYLFKVNTTEPAPALLNESAKTAPSKPYQSAATEALFVRVTELDELQQLLTQAKQQQRKVLIDFYARWCSACLVYEAQTFKDSGLRQQMAEGLLIKADVTAISPQSRALMAHFKVASLPTILFIDSTGEEIAEARLSAFLDASAFSAHLNTHHW